MLGTWDAQSDLSRGALRKGGEGLTSHAPFSSKDLSLPFILAKILYFGDQARYKALVD